MAVWLLWCLMLFTEADGAVGRHDERIPIGVGIECREDFPDRCGGSLDIDFGVELMAHVGLFLSVYHCRNVCCVSSMYHSLFKRN